jgi:hypothetical protein
MIIFKLNVSPPRGAQTSRLPAAGHWHKKIRATFFQSSPYALGSYPLMFYLNTAFAFSVFIVLMFQTKLKNIIIPFQKKF